MDILRTRCYGSTSSIQLEGVVRFHAPLYFKSKMLKTRVIKRKDIAAILEIEELHKSTSFFPSDVKDILKSVDSSCSIVMCENENVIAFVLSFSTEYGTSYLEKVFVHPNYRGGGLQRKLLKKSLELLHQQGVRVCYTMVSPLNEISLSNFKDVGFIEFMDKEYKGHNRKVLVYDFSC